MKSYKNEPQLLKKYLVIYLERNPNVSRIILDMPIEGDGKVKVEIGISESSLQGSQRKLPFSIKKSSVKGSGGKLIENNVFEIDSEKLRQHRSIQFEIVVNTKEVGIDPFDIAIELDKPLVTEDK